MPGPGGHHGGPGGPGGHRGGPGGPGGHRGGPGGPGGHRGGPGPRGHFGGPMPPPRNMGWGMGRRPYHGGCCGCLMPVIGIMVLAAAAIAVILL